MTIIEKERCRECGTSKPVYEVVCENCILQCLDHLERIPKLHLACEDARNLQGGNGGQGSASSDISHNRNEKALEFAVAIELFGMLWDWVTLVCDFREIPEKERPKAYGSTNHKVQIACNFLIVQIQIIRDYPDIAPDFLREIHEHYFKGVEALNDIEEQPRRITCTSPWRESICGRRLPIDPLEPDSPIICPRCRTAWTLRWLEIAHEQKQGTAEEWWDAEMIGLYLQRTPTHIRRLATEWRIPKIRAAFPQTATRFHYPSFISKFNSERNKGESLDAI